MPSFRVFSTRRMNTTDRLPSQPESFPPSALRKSTKTITQASFLRHTGVPVPLWWSAAAAAAAAASRCARSSLAASWAPRAPDRARRPDPPPSARLGCGSPDGCGPTGRPWACWERCCAWSCCCRQEAAEETEGREIRVT